MISKKNFKQITHFAESLRWWFGSQIQLAGSAAVKQALEEVQTSQIRNQRSRFPQAVFLVELICAVFLGCS